jgi:hypothetical protein
MLIRVARSYFSLDCISGPRSCASLKRLQTLLGPWLHWERLRASMALLCEPLQLLNFDCNPDPDTAFHSNADPYPESASQNNADPRPCFFMASGSGI